MTDNRIRYIKAFIRTLMHYIFHKLKNVKHEHDDEIGIKT